MEYYNSENVCYTNSCRISNIHIHTGIYDWQVNTDSVTMNSLPLSLSIIFLHVVSSRMLVLQNQKHSANTSSHGGNFDVQEVHRELERERKREREREECARILRTKMEMKIRICVCNIYHTLFSVFILSFILPMQVPTLYHSCCRINQQSECNVHVCMKFGLYISPGPPAHKGKTRHDIH